MPIYFGSNFAKEPFQFDSVGNDWEQESVNRPNGFPLYHYLQTQEGVGVVTIYDQKTPDHGLQIGHTVELQKGQGILIAPYVAHSYHNKSDTINNHLHWKTEFATFTGTMEPAFKDMFNKDGYWLIDENAATIRGHYRLTVTASCFYSRIRLITCMERMILILQDL